MKTVLIMTCLCVIVLTAPVPVAKKVFEVPVNIPSLVEVDASDPQAAIRKARQLVDVEVDIYNNNGYGYFDNGNFGGYGGYGGGGYGWYGGYGGYGEYGYGGYGYNGCCG